MGYVGDDLTSVAQSLSPRDGRVGNAGKSTVLCAGAHDPPSIPCDSFRVRRLGQPLVTHATLHPAIYLAAAERGRES